MGNFCSKDISNKPNLVIGIQLGIFDTERGSFKEFQGFSLKSFLTAINNVRTNPAKYVNLIPFSNHSLLLEEKPSNNPYEITEAQEFLRTQKPRLALELDPGLTAAAYLRSKHLFESKVLKICSKKEEQLADRINDFGQLRKGRCSESTDFFRTYHPENWVLSFVVDAGVNSRANRKNIFDKEMRRVGLGCFGCAENLEFSFTVIFTGSGYEMNREAIPENIRVKSGLSGSRV